jgi:hypothetical protein
MPSEKHKNIKNDWNTVAHIRSLFVLISRRDDINTLQKYMEIFHIHEEKYLRK